jgi:hypothetical protein
MAFELPTRRPDALFFPTLHVHDRRVHPRAAFDHVLYAQGGLGGAELSAGALGRYVDVARAQGLVDPMAPARRRRVIGEHDNTDVWSDVDA